MKLRRIVVKIVSLLRWGPWFEPWVGSPRIFKVNFHQHTLSNLLIASYVNLEGSLYSVFYAEASKRPWTSLN